MKIWTLWRQSGDSDEMPWLVSSYDEYTAEEHNGEPDSYAEAKKPGDREMIIVVPELDVRALFYPPTVKGKVQT